jgi:hypothetical protein
MNMAMLRYDQAAHARLVKDYLHLYHQDTKEMTTGTEAVSDKYGNVIALVGYISVKLKDDAEIMADLAKMQHVRVVRH